MSCSDSSTARQWSFSIDNGNIGEMSIVDPLLDTEARAEERANSEFLKNGYTPTQITFQTYLTNLLLNQIIIVGGTAYMIKTISIMTDKVKTVNTITAVRYD